MDNRRLTIETNEGSTNQVDLRLKDFSKLINNICQDYSIEQAIKIEIGEDELAEIIKFCEIVDYQPVEIGRPIIDPGKTLDEVIKPNKKLFEFYDNLKSEDIVKCFKICDYMDIPLLENVLYLKLLECFGDLDKMNKLFGNVSPDSFRMNKEEELVLKKKYIDYLKNYTETLSDKELDALYQNLS
jgi:hypothetical protein